MRLMGGAGRGQARRKVKMGIILGINAKKQLMLSTVERKREKNSARASKSERERESELKCEREERSVGALVLVKSCTDFG